MRIRDFLKHHFLQRLEQSSCVVFYDPEGRYREIVKDLAQDDCRVIDGSTSTILAREEAMECWRGLADQPDPIRPMLIYLPVRKPNSEPERQRNPYQALEQDEAWPTELKRFARSILGLKLKTKSQKWKPIQEEVARFVLFSEFTLDLPEELPGDLRDVPKADESRRDLIYNVCETLRTSQKHQVA